jgi:hypothetical protein
VNPPIFAISMTKFDWLAAGVLLTVLLVSIEGFVNDQKCGVELFQPMGSKGLLP